ncbi:hypothetical protein GUITHDRAFT_103927 [Guillardia theta CCMP2712]|uniref:Amidase domain-containing protein n=1 Tax=Guillardia theta (strain CCMP2712) TaxID=905079 RepID=L1JPA2_GUITC|nr:hypothetical protein GUITHDRAFT_103927 [Guillardia theta CCMP2712]EKX50114.1 hypothetical protein GUITHDRAFT_103927 [Guillardia theta CCMP2712]|eukprot:XP_005837094.1 hypothetical protein GUITHDRAFT_103927 [Guillardia theta CCMP2712]
MFAVASIAYHVASSAICLLMFFVSPFLGEKVEVPYEDRELDISLLHLSATEMAELVDLSIRQIVRVNRSINAAVAERFAQARQEAARADERVAEARAKETLDSLPPLLGVPFSVKESFSVQGMPNTSGLIARTGRIAHVDAKVVKRLRTAGAIPVCVSNVSELCMWMESYNYVYGLTKNPYSLRHSVGGSSGGEAALVASCSCVPFGVGSDVGGSIRIPSAFNGVFGHKPTGGLIPNDGQHPISGGSARHVLATGPICKRACDLLPLLRIFATPSKLADVSSLALPEKTLGDGRAIDLSKIREIVKRQEAIEQFLESRGAEVRRVSTLPFLSRSLHLWSTRLLLAQHERSK